MKVIHAYDTSSRVEYDGRDYPAKALMADARGVRMLLTDSNTLPEQIYLAALEKGAKAILWVSDGRVRYLLDEHFAELKQTSDANVRRQVLYTVAPECWVKASSLLSYVEMVLASNQTQGFVHLHTHTEHSALDGLSTVDEIIEAAIADGQEAIAITDHGVCSGHPMLALAAERMGIKPIFGMEAYLVDDRFARGGKSNDYWHLVLWAMDDEGLRNLWAMSTESYAEGFYYKPRLDWDTLTRLNKGVMASTACLGGPVLDPWHKDDSERALANLARLKAIFDDRLYIELHTNAVPLQMSANHWMVEQAAVYNIPYVAVVDSHYCKKSEYELHQIWLAVQTNKELADRGDDNLFSDQSSYHFMTQQEVRAALLHQGLADEVVEKAIANTAVVASRCTAKMTGKTHNPCYNRDASLTYEQRVEADVDKLWELCMARWEKRTIGKSYSQEVAMERFEREFKLIISKGFAGYFLMNWDIVTYAKENGVLVGPGRGSGGGSLVAYILGIIEVDPIEGDLLFERFMTEGRTELPDFDIDYPSSRKMFMLEYVSRRWGNDHIAIVGTHLRLKNKGCINDTARALKSSLDEMAFTEFKQVATLIDEAEADTAGLGMSWEDLWAQHGEVLEPYRERYPEVFAVAGQLRGRLKTYSKHAAGVIIDPDDTLTGNLPLWKETDAEYMTTQFDKNVLEKLGYVKFDMLNIANLDIVQHAVDLIYEKTGRRISPYDWRDEYEDPFIWDEISDGWTMGIFQIGTTSGTRLTKRFRPKSIAELSDVITLVRPGPMRSGLTEMYFRRRAGEEEVSFVDPRLKTVLAKTYGCMLYQEDIMATTMVLAGYGGDEADGVRKILGKKLVEKAAEAGRKFRMRAGENGTNEAVAELLWDQMAEFAKYSFNRAHAYAYAIVGYWTAWLKFHYPVQFLCAALSTVKQERIPEFVEEARRMGYRVLPPDVNESKVGFTAQQMSVRYGLQSIKGVGPAAAQGIISAQPYTSWSDFLERKGNGCNMGHIKTLVRIGAFDSLLPNRRGIEALIAEQEMPPRDRCVNSGPIRPITLLPCNYDWDNEPVELGRTGKPKKGKPPPAKCTKACRQFTERAPLDPLTVPPYTEEDIRRIEMEFLGVFLSSTPFDRVPQEDRDTVSTAMDVLTGPPGSYLMLALIKSFRPKAGGDRYGRKMGWLSLTTERGELDCVVFSKKYEQYGVHFRPGLLSYVTVFKNERGQQLDLFMALE